jgi:hypothetical protein
MLQHGGSDRFPVSAAFIKSFLQTGQENRCLHLIALIHFFREQGLSAPAIVEQLDLKKTMNLEPD